MASVVISAQSLSEAVHAVLSEYEHTPIANGKLYMRAIVDATLHRYALVTLGKDERGQRAREVEAYLEIIDEKIWIQADHTEAGIASDLLRHGVPRAQIVLGFRSPELRAQAGFVAG